MGLRLGTRLLPLAVAQLRFKSIRPRFSQSRPEDLQALAAANEAALAPRRLPLGKVPGEEVLDLFPVLGVSKQDTRMLAAFDDN
jgi:hypothetical protein